jgi:hypothetical protein
MNHTFLINDEEICRANLATAQVVKCEVCGKIVADTKELIKIRMHLASNC